MVDGRDDNGFGVGEISPWTRLCRAMPVFSRARPTAVPDVRTIVQISRSNCAVYELHWPPFVFETSEKRWAAFV